MKLFKSKKIHVEHEQVEKKPDKGDIPLDIFQKNGLLYIVALVAGVGVEDIRLSISGDVLSIKGERFHDSEFNVPDDDFFNKECHWGNFHRSVVFPVKTDIKKVTASFKNGILTIKIPMIKEKIDDEEITKLHIS